MFTNCKWGGTQGRAHISGQPGRGRENPGAWWAGGGGQGTAEASGELSPQPPPPPSPALLVSIETLIPVLLCHLTCAASEFVQSQRRAMLWAPLLGLPAPPKTLGALWILGGKERAQQDIGDTIQVTRMCLHPARFSKCGPQTSSLGL